MQLGDKVKCTGYIKKSGNYFHIHKEKGGTGLPNSFQFDHCYKIEKQPNEQDDIITDIEDYEYVDRFKTIKKEFEGIYVGTTYLCVKLLAEYVDDTYRCYWRTSTTGPKSFAVVYYADNKKRLVPIDMCAPRIKPEDNAMLQINEYINDSLIKNLKEQSENCSDINKKKSLDNAIRDLEKHLIGETNV